MRDNFKDLGLDNSVLIDYGSQKVQVSKNAVRNEEMQQLYQIIMRMVIQIVLPHYLLLVMLNYVYRPRLARMILTYTQEKLEIIQIKKSFNLVKFFNEGNTPGSNGHRYEQLNLQAYNNLCLRNIRPLTQYKFMKVISVDFHELVRKFTVNLLKIQEYLEDQRFYLSPKLKDCFTTIIPCKSKVIYGV